MGGLHKMGRLPCTGAVLAALIWAGTPVFACGDARLWSEAYLHASSPHGQRAALQELANCPTKADRADAPGLLGVLADAHARGHEPTLLRAIFERFDCLRGEESASRDALHRALDAQCR